MYVSGNYAYVADWGSGLQVIDVTIPSLPSLAGSYDTSGNAYGVCVSGNYTYVADGSSGKLYILLNRYTLALSSGIGGTTNPTPGTYKYENGTVVALTATPDSGYAFSGWSGDVSSGQRKDNPLSLTLDSSKSITANFLPPTISLSTSVLNFGATISGDKTSDQQFRVSNSGGGSISWNVTDDKDWLSCDPTAGEDTGVVTVSVNPSGLPEGTYNATISVFSTDASNSPQAIAVTLAVKDLSDSNLPFGSFDTPIDGSIVMSSVPITGWALDDIEVQSVKIYRNPVSGEGSDRVYIGDAVFVEGARGDVEIAYPDYPNNYKAGWGYMMLTNFLPSNGNGTFVIHAYAFDKDGHEVSLGTKTITCDNANAVKPFGAIDVPGQGAATSGKFWNGGWTLTPLPNTIPTDGATINVYVDGQNLGHPTYNQYRDDIATLFPGYANSQAAAASYYLDTTTYTNGVHTIAWSVKDDAGNTDGIGSRFFSISNTGGSGIVQGAKGFTIKLRSDDTLEKVMGMPVNFDSLRVKRGFRGDVEPKSAITDPYGVVEIEIKEVERLELELGKGSGYRGYTVVGDQLRQLPIGSTLDRAKGIFYWQPGPGFIGKYDLVFTKENEFGMLMKIQVKVKIRPKFGKLSKKYTS